MKYLRIERGKQIREGMEMENENCKKMREAVKSLERILPS